MEIFSIFEATEVFEDSVVTNFIDQYCDAGTDHPPKRHAHHHANSYPSSSSRSRELLDKEPAVPGEQVAAKANKDEDVDGSWILANVLDFDARSMSYTVQDEDDVSRVIQLPVLEVKRLDDTSSHLRKGDRVLAVFPDTTSFYKAVVAKNPKPPSHVNAMWDVVVSVI
jgi:hypothetical protein